MSEYIERGALIAAYDAAHKGPPGGARKLMEDAPAADVVEVKRGRWVKNDYGQTMCTHCKSPIPGYWGQYDGCPDGIWTEIEPTNYCPNCGCRMDGGNK